MDSGSDKNAETLRVPGYLGWRVLRRGPWEPTRNGIVEAPRRRILSRAGGDLWLLVVARLTPPEGMATLPRLPVPPEPGSARGAADEANLPAQPGPTPPRPRIPLADEDGGRPRGPAAPAIQGAEAAGRDYPLEVAVATGTGRFRPADRLRRPGEFQHVMRHGRRGAVPLFIVLAVRPRGLEPGRRTRLGITVSRRVGSAVERNRIKRAGREWFRRERSGLAPGADLVVVARSAAAGRPAAELREALSEAARRAGVGQA
jgi:ribonuclease P protein component